MEIWISIAVGLMTGIIAGLISGVLISEYFRRKDKKRRKEQDKFRIFDVWYDELIRLINKLDPFDAFNIKWMKDTWDIGENNPDLMNRLLIIHDKLQTATSENAVESKKTTEKEQKLIDEAFDVIYELNKWTEKNNTQIRRD